MIMIELAPLSNGAHRNQTATATIPVGWAIVPDNMETPNFPFGTVEAEEINGVMTVTAWTAGELPPVEPLAPVEATADELLNILLGGNLDE